MTLPEPPSEPSQPLKHQLLALPTGESAALRLLASAMHALAGLPPDADDAALLSALGPVMVPELGDLCLLHTADNTGELHLIGVEPPDSEAARTIPLILDQRAATMVVYEALVDEPRPLLVSANQTDRAEHVHLLRAAGLRAEIVAPLNAGLDGDALLVIDRLGDGLGQERPPETDDLLLVELLATLLSTWRASREVRRREGALRVRFDEIALAGREFVHLLNNSLTMPVGVIELLLDRNILPAELQEMVTAAASDLASLEHHIRAFQAGMRAPAGARSSPATQPVSHPQGQDRTVH